MAAPRPPADGSSPATAALTKVLASLAATDRDVAVSTGGVAAADVLAAFARGAAQELAKHFDELPGRAVDGVVGGATGWRGWFGGTHRLRHKVLAVRCTLVEPALSLGTMMASYDVTGSLLAIGEDGALRTAAFEESVTILATSTIPVTMLPWTDERIHGVPSTRVRMRPWLGGNDAAQVAPAEHVLELLTLAATTLQRQKAVQGDMLRRLMGA